MKTCVLCPTIIKPPYRLCRTCHKEFGTATKEQWFKELEQLQQRQDTIDRKESFSLFNNIGSESRVQVGRKVGRPPTDSKLVDNVLALYDASIERERLGLGKRLSLRHIEKLMDHKVKFLVVRRILMEYRYNWFPYKNIT